MVAAQGIAADVSYIGRMMSRDMEGGGKSAAAAPITRNLLGGCCELESKELDLDLQVPTGWEKRLDLKTGKIYLQRSNSSSSSEHHKKQSTKGETSVLQDLNFPPKQQPLTLFDESTLDLKLFSSTPTYQSVCTLDKVRSALERAEKETATKKRSMSMSKSSSPPSNSSTSSINADHEEKSCSSFAAGCPNCLLYVLISKENPTCPRCNAVVPSPGAMKKPRIDLNISI